MATTTPPPPSALTKRMLLARNRVSKACSACKTRKVKCDGNSPCSNCRVRGQHDTCIFTPDTTPRRLPRRLHGGSISGASSSLSSGVTLGNDVRHPRSTSPSPPVPKDAELHYDHGGKAIFIGDCAPLSFFNTVRSLVASCGSLSAFETFAVLQNSQAVPTMGGEVQIGDIGLDAMGASGVDGLEYRMASAALLDVWTPKEIQMLERGHMVGYHGTGTIDKLAIGLSRAISIHRENPELSLQATAYLRQHAFMHITDTSLGILRVFLLLALSTLLNSQINTSFVILGVAGRLAYALGIHRSEINSQFSADEALGRERLWKSLRVLDLNAAIALGRPPATSDVDCTVKYEQKGEVDGTNGPDLLNAHVQILKVTEDVIVEVYSKQKLSPDSTNAIASRLEKWSTKWMQVLSGLVTAGNMSGSSDADRAAARGATRVMSAYYYAVMLSTRPFLMYELHIRLSSSPSSSSLTSDDPSERTKFAHACLSATLLLVKLYTNSFLPIDPVLASNFLFVSALVLGAGFLGSLGSLGSGFGDGAEKAVALLQTYKEYDHHANQYAAIVDGLLAVSRKEHKRREERLENERRREGNRLFGLPMDQDAEKQQAEAPVLVEQISQEVEFSWQDMFNATYVDIDHAGNPENRAMPEIFESHAPNIFGQRYLAPIIGEEESLDLTRFV